MIGYHAAGTEVGSLLVLEPFELVLANPLHIRNVPGRKSDVNDAT